MVNENSKLTEEPGDSPRSSRPTGSGMDVKDKAVIRGLVSALAAYCCATDSLVVTGLTGILWTEEEANALLPNAEHIARHE